MGLDSYGFALPEGENLKDRSQFEIIYWRKHYPLHDWMTNLYRERGGTEAFNCIPLELTSKDIEKLSKDMKTWVFDVEIDLEFIRKARIALREGCQIFYDSWW
jgi:hypothetical protein